MQFEVYLRCSKVKKWCVYKDERWQKYTEEVSKKLGENREKTLSFSSENWIKQ